MAIHMENRRMPLISGWQRDTLSNRKMWDTV